MDSVSPLPPEVLFHRYFQELRQDSENYKGKQDLDKLPLALRSLLTEIQIGFNKSFAQSLGAIAALVRPLVVHFDYIESQIPNALAFEDEGYCFIGITMALIERLLEECGNLSRSAKVADLLDAGDSDQGRGAAEAGVFTTQLLFVTAHEFGHHVLGHGSRDRDEFWNEVVDDRVVGSLKNQAQESLADAFAVYPTLGWLIESEQRKQILDLFGQVVSPEPVADQMLLLSFMLSVGSFFLVRPQVVLDKGSVYGLTHPPAAVRINGILQTARTWCEIYRPALQGWLTQDRFREILQAAEHASAGVIGQGIWAEQAAFLESPDGSEYFARLAEVRSGMRP